MRILLLLFIFPLVLLGFDQDMEQERNEKMIQAFRESGFGDNEIDLLHASIAANMKAIQGFTDKGLDKENARYLGDFPKENLPELYKKDSAGKTYLDIELDQGESYASYPTRFLYNGRVYLYLNADLSGVEKVIIQYKRINSNGNVFIREMRRIVNNSPGKSTLDENGNLVADKNDDITLEYYSSYDKPNDWPDVPVIESKPAKTFVLNEKENPVPFFKQKRILEKYRQALRFVESEVARKYQALETDRKRMISKMMDFK